MVFVYWLEEKNKKTHKPNMVIKPNHYKKGIIKTECSSFQHDGTFKVAYLSLEGTFLPFKSILLGSNKDD